MANVPPIPAPWCDVPPWEEGRVYASVKEELAACLARIDNPGEHDSQDAYARMKDLIGQDLAWDFRTTLWSAKWLLSGDPYWTWGMYRSEYMSSRATSYGPALRSGEPLTSAECLDLADGAWEVGISAAECRAIARGELSWFRA